MIKDRPVYKDAFAAFCVKGFSFRPQIGQHLLCKSLQLVAVGQTRKP